MQSYSSLQVARAEPGSNVLLNLVEDLISLRLLRKHILRQSHRVRHSDMCAVLSVCDITFFSNMYFSSKSSSITIETVISFQACVTAIFLFRMHGSRTANGTPHMHPTIHSLILRGSSSPSPPLSTSATQTSHSMTTIVQNLHHTHNQIQEGMHIVVFIDLLSPQELIAAIAYLVLPSWQYVHLLLVVILRDFDNAGHSADVW